MKWLDPKTYPIPKEENFIAYINLIFNSNCYDYTTELLQSFVTVGDFMNNEFRDFLHTDYEDPKYYSKECIVAWMPLPDAIQETWSKNWDKHHEVMSKLPEKYKNLLIKIQDDIKEYVLKYPNPKQNEISDYAFGILRTLAYVNIIGYVSNEICKSDHNIGRKFHECYQSNDDFKFAIKEKLVHHTIEE